MPPGCQTMQASRLGDDGEDDKDVGMACISWPPISFIILVLVRFSSLDKMYLLIGRSYSIAEFCD